MKSLPVPSIFCRMKPSPPKKPAPIRLVNAMLRSIVTDRAEERVLLAEHAGSSSRSRLDDLAGIRPGKRHLPGRAVVTEVRDEEALAREQLPLEAAEKPAFHLGVHLDAVGHVHHRAGFGAHLVARRQREDDRLHVVADDFVCHHSQSSKDIAGVRRSEIRASLPRATSCQRFCQDLHCRGTPPPAACPLLGDDSPVSARLCLAPSSGSYSALNVANGFFRSTSALASTPIDAHEQHRQQRSDREQTSGAGRQGMSKTSACTPQLRPSAPAAPMTPASSAERAVFEREHRRRAAACWRRACAGSPPRRPAGTSSSRRRRSGSARRSAARCRRRSEMPSDDVVDDGLDRADDLAAVDRGDVRKPGDEVVLEARARAIASVGRLHEADVGVRRLAREAPAGTRT